MGKTIIRARAPYVLATLGLCGFSIAGLIIVAHPGADPRLVSRLAAGCAVSIVLWLLWQLGIEPRIVLDDGEIAVYYPFLVRRVGVDHVAQVAVEAGDLTIRTATGSKIKPPAYRASVLSALAGHRGARAAQREIERHLAHGGPRASTGPRTCARLQLWVLIGPLAVLSCEAFLAR